MEAVLRYLRGLGAVPLPEPPCQESPRQRLLSAYERYLAGDRSLSPATVTKYMHIATVFLADLPDPFGDALAGLSADQVIGFVCGKGSAAKSMAGGLRVLLRYLYLSGNVDRQLAGAVPPIAAWRLAGLPARLDAAAVAAVLAACDRATVTSCRDYAVLIMLARLGLRAHEVAGLELDDIRWRGVIRQPRHSHPADQRTSPVLGITARSGQYVFVNLFGGQVGAAMTYPAVRQLTGRIAARTGIGFTAHMLRHSHATDMVRRGVPIEVVARLLTHRSSTTTSQAYVHLDAADIREALCRAGVWQEEGR
jgi:integrase